MGRYCFETPSRSYQGNSTNFGRTINASTTTTNNAATTTNNNSAATTSTNNAAATTAATLNPPPPPNPTGDIYFQFFFGLTAKELAAF
jgi:hypothetical protein